ncbi:MAG TPA: cobalamin-dependent protein [Thermotogota bacterium]|nr:cobalamin-dependent protein [Thermotogota bacterium]HRW93283.1 cobalamin-dependent protein [Thermotogota bacterium]
MEPISGSISDWIEENKERLAQQILEVQYRWQPELKAQFGPKGMQKSLSDMLYTLKMMGDALHFHYPSLFEDYIQWLSEVLAAHGLEKKIMEKNLQATRQVIGETFPENWKEEAVLLLEKAGKRLVSRTVLTDGWPSPVNPLAPIAREYLEALLHTDRQKALRLVQKTVEQGTSIRDIYLHVFQESLVQVGKLWQSNQVSVAREHFVTAATQTIMGSLYPAIFQSNKNGKKVLCTAASSELHEVGIRMVADFFEMEGWDSMFLGANTPLPSILQTLEEFQPDLVAISATLSYHLQYVEQILKQLQQKPVSGLKILVGGLAFNQAPELWKDLGADAWAPNALEALHVGNRLVGLWA